MATHPELLYEAQKKALNANAQIEEAEDLPAEWVSDSPLPTSNKNIYGVSPSDLNEWETSFAELLDCDQHGVVQWWHRNLPRKPWSVNVVLPDGSGFYPDFIVGVAGRKTEDRALLADTKYGFEVAKEVPKTNAEHKVYGKVLILSRDGSAKWMTIRYDEKQSKPVLDRPFSTMILPNY